MTTEYALPTNIAWALRGVYLFSIIFAFVADVALVDQTKKIQSYLRKLERWIKKLPIKAVMRWHIAYLSDRLESSIWKKHPDWICFIVGYLITAALCAHSILSYLPELAKHPLPAPFSEELCPRSALLSPIPANILGGLIVMLIRRLLKWGKRVRLWYIYMAVIVIKVSAGFSLLLMIMIGVGKGIAEFISIYHPGPNDFKSPAFTFYWQSETLGAVIYWSACLANVIWLVDSILYCFEFSLLLWLLSHVAIWFTKAIRMLLKKADGMYCTGAVGACSAFAEMMIHVYPYIAALPKDTSGWIGFYLGLGR